MKSRIFNFSVIAAGIALIISGIVFVASCSGKNDPSKEIASLMDRVADWQTDNFTYSESGSGGHLHDYGLDAWTNATFFTGLCRWAERSAEGDKYFDWLYGIGERNDWKIPANFPGSRYGLYHADEICIGQFYLYMYGRYGEDKMYYSTKERIDYIMANPPDPDLNIRNKQSWTWCDALFMAPPVYLTLENLAPGSGYTAFMDSEFRRTAEYLYDSDERLFYRDDRYFDQREENGEKVFWGRGNGWVAAGLANILKLMPAEYPGRAYYEELFCELTTRLAGLQSPDGFWRASLLDPGGYPSPETSATALIAYAIAYGINNGLLHTDEYSKVLHDAWTALASAVQPDGRPGYVQPIGADPKSVTRDMTAVYGSGAILLAGAETSDLLDNNPAARKYFKDFSIRN